MSKSKRGRRPISDKKEQITIWVKGSIIQKMGGKEKFREAIYKWLNQ